MQPFRVLAASLALFLVISLPLALAAEKPHLGIQGPDDREIVEGNAFPWRAIGRVNNKGYGFCTGVLIGERQVLTAAHCLRSKRGPGGMAPASNIHFLAGYNRGDFLAHSQAESVSRSAQRGIKEQTEDDWAVITLAKPLGKSIGFLPLAGFDASAWREGQARGQLYAQAGYSHDRAHVLTRHRNCRIASFFQNSLAFRHKCDATHGDSGSPILVLRGDAYTIVGLHVASSRTRSFGVAIAAGRIRSQLSSMAAAVARPPRQ